jgi:SSS family solute:Na+ symporter
LIGVLASGATIEKVTAGAFPAIFAATRGGIPAWLGSGAICGVVLIYVFGGGVRSTAWANALQTCIFMVLGAVTLWIIAHKLGGMRAASESVARLRPDLLVRGPVDGRAGHIGHLQFLSYLFIPLSVAMFPHLFQHWMTARSAKAFRATVILHPIFIMIVWLPCILLGIWASTAVLGGKPIVPPDANPNAVLGRMVAALTNDYLTGFLTVGILAAIMSSLDSQFLAIGSMFTHDVVLHYWGEDRFSDRQRILLGRLFVLAIVVVTYLISLGKPGTVFTLGVWCFSGFASLFPLVFAALYWKRTTAAGAIASVVTAAAVWCGLFLWSLWSGKDETQLLYGLMPVTAILAASAAALVLVSLVTRAPAEAVLERYFPTASPKPVAVPPLARVPREVTA